jgi:hypothetical protein
MRSDESNMANSVPTMTGLTTSITFDENTVNATPQIIDADVTLTDPDDNFDGGTLPSVSFDTTSYLAANPDVAAAHINPLTHFLFAGQREGRSAWGDGVWS